MIVKVRAVNRIAKGSVVISIPKALNDALTSKLHLSPGDYVNVQLQKDGSFAVTKCDMNGRSVLEKK